VRLQILYTIAAIGIQLPLFAMDPITAESLVRQGNEAYIKEDYKTAIEYYTEVSKEFASAPLFSLLKPELLPKNILVNHSSKT